MTEAEDTMTNRLLTFPFCADGASSDVPGLSMTAMAIVDIETQSDNAISGGRSLTDGDRGVDTAAIFSVGVSRENAITPSTGGISFTGEQGTPSPSDTEAS